MKKKTRKIREFESLKEIMGEQWTREAWRSLRLLENKYQAIMRDAIVKFVRTGENTEFGSMVLQGMYDKLTDTTRNDKTN